MEHVAAPTIYTAKKYFSVRVLNVIYEQLSRTILTINTRAELEEFDHRCHLESSAP